MGLKDLHLLARDDRAAYPPDQLFRFSAEHDAGDDFDPARTGGLLEHLSLTRHVHERQERDNASHSRRFGQRAAVASMFTRIRGAANDKAKRDLGWAPRYASWREGFRDGLSAHPSSSQAEALPRL